jgi:hypothetical protein
MKFLPSVDVVPHPIPECSSGAGTTLRGAELVEILSVENALIDETFALDLQSIAIAHR